MKMTKILISIVSITLFLGGCTKETVVDDPFILGANTIQSVELTRKTNAILKSNLSLTSEIMHTAAWVETQAGLNTQSVLRMTMLDDQGYRYQIYQQASGDYLVTVKSSSYPTEHRYHIPNSAYTSILLFMADNYWPRMPGILDFVSAMWAKDESTMFPFSDSATISMITRPFYFEGVTEAVDLSRVNCEFSLVDLQDNVYRFYAQANIVEIIYAKDNSVQQYTYDFTNIREIEQLLRTNYPDKLITNQLTPVNFTKVYFNGLSSFSPSKMLPIASSTSDSINLILYLERAVTADVLPDEESNCKIVMKSDDGLYYVVCLHPYVIGVGPDPKGPLTYYNLFVDYYGTNGELANLFYYFPLPAPTGTNLDAFTFTKVYAMTHSERELSVLISGSQSSALKAMMDLAANGTMILGKPYNADHGYLELSSIETSSKKRFDFLVSESSETIILNIDFNGYDDYGSTYYLYEGEDVNKIMEAFYTLTVSLFPDYVDIDPVFDAYYIGNSINYSSFGDNPLTAMTPEQITQIDGLLQHDAWRETSLFPDGPLPNHIDFALRKSATEYYFFSRYGSMSIVVDYIMGGGMSTNVYTMPNSAYDQVFSTLKSYK